MCVRSASVRSKGAVRSLTEFREALGTANPAGTSGSRLPCSFEADLSGLKSPLKMSGQILPLTIHMHRRTGTLGKEKKAESVSWLLSYLKTFSCICPQVR